MSDEIVKFHGADGVEGMDGPCVVTDELTMHGHTQRGWRLVATFEREHTVTVYDSDVRQHVIKLIRERAYLLNQSSELAVKDAIDAKRAAEARENTLESELATVRYQLEQLEKAHDKLTALHDESNSEHDAERTRLWRQLDAKRQMESDLAKIRAAIGELRFKEILAG